VEVKILEGTLNVMKVSVLSKFQTKLNGIFIEMDRLVPKFMWKSKGSKIAQKH
jgi:hypothetical protein